METTKDKSQDKRVRLHDAARLHQSNNFVAAEKMYSAMLREDPQDPQVLCLLGLLSLETGFYQASVDYYHKALRVQDPCADTHLNLGHAYRQLQQWELASEHYGETLRLHPTNEPANIHFAWALFNKGDQLDAIEHLKQAAQSHKGLTFNLELARMFTLRKDWAQVVHYGLQALYFDASNELALHQVASAILSTNRDREIVNTTDINQALDLTQHMIRKNPSSWLAHITAGVAYVMLDNPAMAIDRFQLALSCNPDSAEARTSLGITQLRYGQLQQGWSQLSERGRVGEQLLGMDRDNFARCEKPRWQGEVYAGMRLFIASEQGIGDQILQTQLVHELIEQGVQILLSCTGKLVPLMQRSLPQAEIRCMEDVIDAQRLNAVDYKATLFCLGKYLRRDFSQFNRLQCGNGQGFMLKPDAQQVEKFKKKYRCFDNRLKVGIAWKSQSQTTSLAKSTELDRWLPILGTADTVFFNIQYGETADELEQLKTLYGIDVITDEEVDHFNDIDSSAAQIAALDLVISVSNASVHLAASLGIETWVLLHTRGLWHWFTERDDSPWYDSVRLYRQKDFDGWQPVIEDIAQSLPERVLTHR